jgi:50S ribosomal protein L16 3-hydroxylase
MRLQLLGGLSASVFLSRYWQKKPLLVRNAISDFKGVVQAPELFALATRGEIEARLVQRRGEAWRMYRGPFSRTDLARLPARNWTLLVQGVNLVLPAADALLRRFAFLPYARLDDLMVSYAVAGGSVGPHFDSYDVFLLQGPGRRRWSISRQRDKDLDPGAPLKILRDFRPQEEWLLEPGDMLYLPPGCAHHGVALEPCFTYSIGFRAPSHDEIAREFLAFLQDRVIVGGLYADRDARPARHAAEIPAAMMQRASTVVRKIHWRERDVARFLGEYLSSPKPHVVFTRPRRPEPLARFATRCRSRGLRLDLRTQLLFRGNDFYVNGELVEAPVRVQRWLARLADERALASAPPLPQALLRILHDWYLSGWLHVGTSDA